MGKPFNDRTGEVRVNAYGTAMKIIKYFNVHNIIIEFQDDHKFQKSCYYNDFKRGKIRNPFDLSVQGVGFFGVGDERDSDTVKYRIWVDIFARCYGRKRFQNHPAYIGCSVHPDWHNFQNFAKWYDDDFYQMLSEEMEIDKDLFLKGNKVYGPNTCCFLPARINSLLIKNKSTRGGCPIGVSIHAKKYRAKCSDGKGINIELGRFKTIPEAFYAYKVFKEDLIKNIANEIRDYLPEKVYAALLSYKVEEAD